MEHNMITLIFDCDDNLVQVREDCPTHEEREVIRKAGGNEVNRHDIRSFAHAEQLAQQATELMGELYIATDAGAHVSPRIDVIRAPAVGDKVSYAFNGDSYPCGRITAISPTLKKVTTSEGDVFYRRRQSGAWVKGGTWSMVRGHVSARNPSF